MMGGSIFISISQKGSKMGKKKDQEPSSGIQNFWLHDIHAFSFDLTKFDDPETNEPVYNPILLLHLKVEEIGNDLKSLEMIMFQTDVWAPDIETALKTAFSLASNLLKTDNFYSGVTIYDEFGDEIERVQMAQFLDQKEYVSQFSNLDANVIANSSTTKH